MTTVADVAKLAGVSTATVSRVLNGYYPDLYERFVLRRISFKPSGTKVFFAAEHPPETPNAVPIRLNNEKGSHCGPFSAWHVTESNCQSSPS